LPLGSKQVKASWAYRTLQQLHFAHRYSNRNCISQLNIFFSSTIFMVGRDSAVGIANALRARRSGDRIPVAARFYAPVQIFSEVYPASYTMDNESFPVIKRPGRGVDHPPLSSADSKERVELYIYSGPLWPVLG
jgi:hypothetical protein